MLTVPFDPAVHALVLDWYAEHGRTLAFRGTTDPWAILVSEVMAQQTQAARAAEAWTAFMAAFPTPASFAAASPATALRAWRGLGYNRRALALRDAAMRIVEDHGGRVPASVEALRALPGVGPYTARAVAAIAFGAAVGPVDTNVRRVLLRAFFEDPPAARELQAFADAVVPARAAGEWTHALMDVGARFCRPRAPRCDACPLARTCRYATGTAPASDQVLAGRQSPSRLRGSAPFHATTRWLRGRILDRLRDATDGEWIAFDQPIGSHGLDGIQRALGHLAAEGLLERHPIEPASARLAS